MLTFYGRLTKQRLWGLLFVVFFASIVVIVVWPQRAHHNSVIIATKKEVRGGDILEIKRCNCPYKVTTTEENTRLSRKGSHCDIYDVSVPINENYKCVTTKTKPAFPVCIYSAKEDIYVSVFLEQRGIWEKEIISEFQNELNKDPSMGLIDIGTNLGFYSLISAKMGHKVVSIEPNIETVKHFHKSLQVGKLWEKVVMVTNGVSNTRGSAAVARHPTNKGDSRVLQKTPADGKLQSIKTIVLDDLLEVIPFNKSIIKIDIQGYEHKAFQEAVAGKLMSRIRVPVVFFEWVLLGKMLLAKNTPAEDRKLICCMLDFFSARGYIPYKLKSQGGHDLSLVLPKYWPPDIVFRLTT